MIHENSISMHYVDFFNNFVVSVVRILKLTLSVEDMFRMSVNEHYIRNVLSYRHTVCSKNFVSRKSLVQ